MSVCITVKRVTARSCFNATHWGWFQDDFEPRKKNSEYRTNIVQLIFHTLLVQDILRDHE